MRIGQTPPKDHPELYRTAQALEGVFVQQMYKAMRSTVPTNPLVPESGGEEMFTGLLDEHLATDTPKQWDRGLTEAIYKQLSKQFRSTTLPNEPPSSSR